MDFVLAFSLILAFLSIGQSYTEWTEQTNKLSCYELCPPGYHKDGDCDDPVIKHACKKCEGLTYTDIPNSRQRCERCDSCGKNQVVIKPCSFNSNVVCECKEGFYNAGHIDWQCRSCPHKDCKGRDKKKCQFDRTFQECLKHPECKRICISPPSTNTITTTTTATTTFMTMTATATRAPALNNTLNPVMNPVPEVSRPPSTILIMFLVMTAVVLFWLLLLFIRKLLKYLNSCPCCSKNKDLEPSAEDPKFNEQHSQQGCRPTTLVTFNISEETPMMTLSQSPDHPTHINPLVPDSEHKAASQKEQSEHWPAIVLYTIIREVPLRRWKEFLRLLSVADQQLERVEMEAGLGLGFTERQYQMLRLWSQRASASLSDIFSALHYMDLSGCAQLLQESLEKLQWRPEPMQGFTACRGYTDHGFSGAMQHS